MMDKMREEFEAWCPTRIDRVDEKHGGYYVSERTRWYWDAWKSSRESLVVELPHMADYVNMLGQVDKCYSYLDDLHAAIHAAGIRTK